MSTNTKSWDMDKKIKSNALICKPTEKELKRFFSYVHKTNTCWLWSGCKGYNGYGQTYYRGRKERSHRLSYAFFNGKLEPGLVIMHTCDNPSCVNPKHLRQGTAKANTIDCSNKQRLLKGEQQKQSKLKKVDILKIKKLYKEGLSCAKIGERFDVSHTNIWFILTGKKWRHIL